MNFQSSFEDNGPVVFVISNKTASKRLVRVVGFANGVIKRVSFDSLSVQHVLKVDMMTGEQLTCGYYCENELNFVFGTNYGSVFFANLSIKNRTRIEYATYCRITNL